MEKDCEVCGTSFWARERKGRSEPYSRFCSKECYWKWRIGKRFSDVCFKKGHIPWSKGKMGLLSDESRKKMSESAKGRPSPMKGKKHTKEALKKMRLSAKGRPSPMEGKKHTKETLKKMSERRIGKYRGENSSLERRSEAQYRRLHRWVERELGKPTKCEFCLKDNLYGHKIHWSNISGEYRLVLADWQRLCVRCHKKFDGYKVKS